MARNTDRRARGNSARPSGQDPSARLANGIASQEHPASRAARTTLPPRHLQRDANPGLARQRPQPAATRTVPDFHATRPSPRMRWAGYFKVSGIGAPMRSKASRWALVGSVSMGTVAAGAGEPDLVAGQGGQVGEQAAEAAVGAAGAVALAGGLGLGGGRAAGGGDRVAWRGRVLVGEGQRRPGLAQVPGQVGGEHADQHVGLDAFFEPVEDRAQVQVVGLDVAGSPARRGRGSCRRSPRRGRRVRRPGRGCG